MTGERFRYKVDGADWDVQMKAPRRGSLSQYGDHEILTEAARRGLITAPLRAGGAVFKSHLLRYQEDYLRTGEVIRAKLLGEMLLRSNLIQQSSCPAYWDSETTEFASTVRVVPPQYFPLVHI